MYIILENWPVLKGKVLGAGGSLVSLYNVFLPLSALSYLGLKVSHTIQGLAIYRFPKTSF